MNEKSLPGRSLRPANVLTLLMAMAVPLAILAREPAKPKCEHKATSTFIDLAWSALDEEINIQNLDKSIKYLLLATELEGENHEILAELSDEYFWRGHLMPSGCESEISARNVYFQKGVEAAQRSLDIKESAAGHYWYAANLGVLNEYSSVMKQAAIFPEIIGHVQWVIDNDPDYKYGVAARFWAGLMAQAPPLVARMVGRDPAEIMADLDRAVEKTPAYLENYVSRAILLRYLEKEDKAFDNLSEAIKRNPEDLFTEKAQNRQAQVAARKLWKEWAGKEYPNR